MFLRGKTKNYGARYIMRAKKSRVIGTIASCFLVLFGLLSVFPIAHKTEDAEATATASVTTLAVTTSKDTASVSLTPNGADGAFAVSAAADEAAFTVTTDNIVGYNVSIVSSDASGQLVNEAFSSVLDPIASDTTESTFRNGDAATYSNKWGFRLKINNTTTTNFLAAPTTSTPRNIHTTAGPNVTPDSFTIGLGARVDCDVPKGTYENTFVLAAVGNPINYEVDYLDNSSDASLVAPTLPAADVGTNVAISGFNLSTTIPVRGGYDFSGWCSGTVTHVDDGDSMCSGTVYQPGDAFPVTPSTTSNLYAMWEAGAPYYLQKLSLSQCRNIATSANYTLYDQRDGNDYTVRYIDGTCWMTQNLRFHAAASAVSTLDPATSNVPNSVQITWYNGYSGSSANDNKAYFKDSTNVLQGTWYNYTAATAESLIVGGGDINSTREQAPYDICPKGWRLPNDGDINTVADHMTEFSPINGGTWDRTGSTANKGTSGGDWWSSSPIGLSQSSMLTYSGSVLNVKDQTRYDSRYVRCVLKEQTFPDSMQSMTPAEAATLSEGDSLTLSDSRDGNIYTVKKINGDLWMTQNLRFVGMTVDSTTSNVPAAYTTQNPLALDWDYWAGDGSGGYEYARSHAVANKPRGRWYTYAGATALTITGSVNTSSTAYDICPKGWRLPTINDFTGITSSSSAFSPVNGGVWYNSAASSSSEGYWWSSEPDGVNNRMLRYTGSALALYSQTRYDGRYVRCIYNNGATSNPAMQDVTSQFVDGLAEGKTTVLADNRDGNTYTVAKLGGNLWMTQNLRLDPNTVTMDSTNTNVDLNYVQPSYGDTKTEADRYTPTRADTGSISKGYWYNFIGASAGTRNESSTDDSTQDICPKGWRLPTRGEFSNLIGTAVNTLNYVTGGGYGIKNGTWQNIDTATARWWTSNLDGENYTNQFVYGSSSLYFTMSNTRGDGWYVRCVYDHSSYDAMQDITTSYVANMNNGDDIKVVDNRDGSVYDATKVNGNLWMTQNLRINPTTVTFDSTNTNIPSNWTPIAKSTWGIVSQSTWNSGKGGYRPDRTYSGSGGWPAFADSSNINKGYWYNYRAAVLKEGYKIADGEPTYDICPKGWRLPTKTEAATVKSYTTQFKAGNGIAGAWWTANSQWKNQNTSYAYWYTSTITGSNIYILRSTASSMADSTSNSPTDAYTIRCIFGG